MPKVIPRRSAPLIDMTAMVDVAFLLLTFFILTTTFRAEEAAVIRTPSSVSDTTPDREHQMFISIDSAGRVFIGFSDIPTREAVLAKIMEEYKISINEEGQKFFVLQPSLGVPFSQLGTWLNQPVSQMKKIAENQGGIPYPFLQGDSKENELKRWIMFAYNADNMISKNVAIKADLNTPITAFEEVTASLQSWNINRFNLITELEEAPGPPAEGAEGGK